MSKTQLANAYINGELPVPTHLQPIVEEFNKRNLIVQTCESYPQHIDDEMNKLFDALEVMA